MKQHSNQKPRPRGRMPNQQRKGNGPSRNHTYDSNGPSVRIRGSAHQVMEKYLALARDAAGQGDRVLAENYLQHAEHYFRIIQSTQPRQPRVVAPVTPESPDDAQPDVEAEGASADDVAEDDAASDEAVVEVIRPVSRNVAETTEEPEHVAV